MSLLRSVLVLLLMSLAGCGSVAVEQYRAERPALDLQRYFDGTIDAWGVFQDRSGKVVKRFTVRIDARWSGNTGILDEHFEYSDGSKSRRVWTLERIDEHGHRQLTEMGRAARRFYETAVAYGRWCPLLLKELESAL